MPRIPLPKPDGLNSTEAEAWDDWNELYGPLIIGDGFAQQRDAPLPFPSEIAWCTLNSLGVLLANHTKLVSLHKDDTVVPVDYIHLAKLWHRYIAARTARTARFYGFVFDWELGFLFPSIIRTRRVSQRPLTYDLEQRVLGLHTFSRRSEVDNYICRWRDNPDIKSIDLARHRLVVGRGIDLVCSELIANAFEHNTSSEPKVYVIAKLTTQASAKEAIRQHQECEKRKVEYLTPSELSLNRLCDKRKLPFVELVILDNGGGFGNNARLREAYRDLSQNDPQPLTEGALIQFALDGNVSTKSIETIAEEWKQAAVNPEDLEPETHGLSEIVRYIAMAGGIWRIHSNETLLEFNFLREFSNGTGAEHIEARRIPGCLHYIAFPLYESLLHDERGVTEALPELTHFQLIDSSSFIYEKTSPFAHTWTFAPQIAKFRDSLLRATTKSSEVPIAVNLSAFDALEDSDVEHACAITASTLFRIRNDIAVFLFGASDRVRSHLHRYSFSKSFFRERRILVFIVPFTEDGASRLEIECSETLQETGVKPFLREVLSSPASIVVSPSDALWSAIEALKEVVAMNQALLHMKQKGDAFAVSTSFARVTSAQNAYQYCISGLTTAHMAALLRKHKAIAFQKSQDVPFLRLGKRLSFYMHLARICSDPELRSAAVAWMSALIPQFPREDNNIDTRRQGVGLVLLAVLHPAIELCHSLIRTSSLSRANIVSIGRVSDVRWDYRPLAATIGQDVVVVTDVVGSGATVNRVADAITYLGGRVIGAVSLLADARGKVNCRHYSLCFYRSDELLQMLK